MHCQVEGMEGNQHDADIAEGQTKPTTTTTSTTSARNNETHATITHANNGSDVGKPKAWIILRHYLTSDEFV